MSRSYKVDTEESVRIRLVREGVALLNMLTQARNTEMLVTAFCQPLPAHHVAPQYDRIQDLDLTVKPWPLVPCTLLALAPYQLAERFLWLLYSIPTNFLSPDTPARVTLTHWGYGEDYLL